MQDYNNLMWEGPLRNGGLGYPKRKKTQLAEMRTEREHEMDVIESF